MKKLLPMILLCLVMLMSACGGNPGTPAAVTAAPADNTSAPTDATTAAPAEDTASPAEDTTAPVEDAVSPTDEADEAIPADDTPAPVADHVKLSLQSYNFVAAGDFSDPDFDLIASFDQLSKAGYEGLEWCGFFAESFGMETEAVAEAYNAAGLDVTGYHFHLGDELESAAATAVERCQILGTDKLIFAYSTPAMFGMEADEDGNWTPEQIDQWAAEVNNVLETLKKAAEGTDIMVMYHNHAPEFFKGTDGRYMLDTLDCDGIEVDVYWASKNANMGYSEANVLDYIRENQDKVKLLHVKDGLNGSSITGEMCGWGKGTFDIQAIIDVAKECGIESVIVENDNPTSFALTGMQDALQSAEYAKTLNFTK